MIKMGGDNWRQLANVRIVGDRLKNGDYRRLYDYIYARLQQPPTTTQTIAYARIYNSLRLPAPGDLTSLVVG